MTEDQRSGALTGLKVLVVEDQYFLADEISQALTDAGADVVGPFREMADGYEALERNPNLAGAVLDINLDGIMVFPIADALRARGVPFLFTTGYDERSIPTAYCDVPRCEKPINAADVIRRLDNLVKQV